MVGFDNSKKGCISGRKKEEEGQSEWRSLVMRRRSRQMGASEN